MSAYSIRRLKSDLQRWETAICDTVLGVNTLGCEAGERPHGAFYSDASKYHSKCYSLIWQYLRPVRFQEDDVFYDVGCGAGRVLCLVACRQVRKCVGIELSELLCKLAAENACRLKHCKSVIEIVQGDAALADYRAGTVYFFFNPFG